MNAKKFLQGYINKKQAYDIARNTVSKLVVKSNSSATTNPTTDDDYSLGYRVGSQWTNISSGEIFQCVDPSNGSAVWKNLTASGEAGQPINYSFTNQTSVTIVHNLGYTPITKVYLDDGSETLGIEADDTQILFTSNFAVSGTISYY